MGREKSVGGYPLDPEAIAVPCGAIARSLPTEKYRLESELGIQILIDERPIVWGSESSFKNSDSWLQEQWIDMTDCKCLK